MKITKLNFRFLSTVFALGLSVIFCSVRGNASEVESVYIERKMDGTAVISNILIDDSDGTTVGIPHSSVTDSSGVVTGESVSVVGSNFPPVISVPAAFECYPSSFSVIFTVYDPDGPPGPLVADEPWGSGCVGHQSGGFSTFTYGGANGSLADISKTRSHACSSGVFVSIPIRVTDPQGLEAFTSGGCWVP